MYLRAFLSPQDDTATAMYHGVGWGVGWVCSGDVLHLFQQQFLS